MYSKNPFKSFKTHAFTFGAVPISYASLNSTICIILLPFETTSDSKLTAKGGPEAILNASRNLELYDFDLKIETYKVGIYTLNEIEPSFSSPYENCKLVESIISSVVKTKMFPVLIGGDHSISYGAFQALQKYHPDIGILIFDAHPDLFNEYKGTKYGNASVTRRIYELDKAITILGLRSASREECNFLAKSNIQYINAREIINASDSIDDVINSLPSQIYISIDLDVLDPSEMPSVAYPEPGGLRWYDLLDALDKVISKKNVLGFDVVELSPIAGNPAPDFLAAKLIYRMIGLIFKDKLLNGKY